MLYLKEVKTVLVSPDGSLARIPFGALPGEKSSRYVCEEFGIVTVPAPAMIPQFLATNTQSSGGLFGMGGVNYGGNGGRANLRGNVVGVSDNSRSWMPMNFSTLDNTGPEVDGVRKLFDTLFSNVPSVVKKEADSTEAEFRQHAPTARWLHLATHAFYAPELMMSVFTEYSDQPPSEFAVGVSFHPGLLSGIALTGANSFNSDGRDDGILSSLEVSSMDLSNIELAVLSACQTAQGKSAGGEGVLGLQRAFQVAGARSVVATLWSINDLGTRLLMMRFYSNLWIKRMPKLEALVDAQRWMLSAARAPKPTVETEITPFSTWLPETFGHPSIWAPFVLSGDWR